ncbi:hypothetical protein [Morganella morganii]|uniref:hypothetical protein n=1 Tax=Morganella morganii TaxID=582 RepID=UPI000AC895C7|nr:hypothetical protein [Morganella morganii]MBT0306298.1 hypothetical protein [Morganella morganii subsp. morganii]HCT9738583.1 hypothetical protein [Morganella morganii]HDS3052965.1 hypothetical protein [Morganella morganii subsp. morganii]HDS6885505.1 hypothetical protein [Morganella morganii subsp. morganii]HDS6887746.1 hypothetical protein [Morganella morganii subsp. morganii]
MLAHFTEVRNTFPVISGQQAGDNTTELINQRKTDEKKTASAETVFQCTDCDAEAVIF